MNADLSRRDRRSILTMAGLLTAAAATGALAGITGATPALACDEPVGPAVLAPLEEEPSVRTIDLAICLDTSGSMSGLIEAAKQKLWAIVNDLALAEPAPELRVALLTFGNDGHNAEDGWVAVQTPLTEDLDLVSQKLFALSTNGGTELVGRVLNHSTQLAWHPSDDALKLVVVAGNESADQDQETPFRQSCRDLIGRGIMVNSIYCGPENDEIAPGWREVARLADGQFASIDKDHGTVVIETPFDEQLNVLSVSLNGTYLPMGNAGQTAWANQREQDANAASLNSEAAATRAQTKASGLYVCSWDLVDGCAAGDVKLEELKDEELPEIMRPMTLEERQAHVAKMSADRAEVQKQIAELAKKRDAYVQAEMQRQSLDDSTAFDRVLRAAIRGQASAKGFRFPEPAAAAPETAPESTPEAASVGS